jgi:hypothetical protein
VTGERCEQVPGELAELGNRLYACRSALVGEPHVVEAPVRVVTHTFDVACFFDATEAPSDSRSGRVVVADQAAWPQVLLRFVAESGEYVDVAEGAASPLGLWIGAQTYGRGGDEAVTAWYRFAVDVSFSSLTGGFGLDRDVRFCLHSVM